MKRKREKCPICRVLRGEKGRGKTLCRDCSENQALGDSWQKYQIFEKILSTQVLYAYWFPVMLILTHSSGIAMAFKVGISFSSVILGIEAWALWLFCLFWLWPKQKIRMCDMKERLAKTRDEMMVAKVAGNHIPDTSLCEF